MKKALTLREGVLKSLLDDGESLVQIERYLNENNIPFTKDLVKGTIINFLNERLIEIAWPPDSKIENFVNSDFNSIDDFWFEITKKGLLEWILIIHKYVLELETLTLNEEI